MLKTRPVLFTTSGSLVDFSEYQGLDNLQHPQGPILKSLQRSAEIYGAKSTFYLVNGSTSGIIALMLATVKKGEKVLIARNAHKSVINALILAGAVPVWAETEWIEEWDIPGPAKIGNIPDDVRAVWLTSPTYEGMGTDIRPIADMCRQKGVPLIVDEAHGALWPFSDKLPTSAIHCGADACVQSLHKTCACLNQGALLHLSEYSKISADEVQKALNIINTTSPSYVLLSSIETTIEYLNSKKGRKKLERLITGINRMKKHSPAVFLENSDPTKIFLRLNGVSGQLFSDFLEDEYSIEVELNNEKGLLALTGIGTTERNLKKLEKAIAKAEKHLPKTYENSPNTPFINPQFAISPAEALSRRPKKVKPEDAVGKISRETIVRYPPGIPLIIPGEILQEGHLAFLKTSGEFEITD